MRLITTIILLSATMALGQVDKQVIIPVDTWPKEVIYNGVQTYAPVPVATCVAAGYRLKPTVKPAPPTGKQIKTETLVQDDKDASMCKYETTYEDIPPPPVVPPEVPEVLVVIPLTNVVFYATSNGIPREWKLKTMPKTNAVVIAE